MVRVLDRERAIKLRKLGCSYSQIKQKIGISRSTLSGWFSKYPLTPKQQLLLKNNRHRIKEHSIEKGKETKRLKREKRIKAVYDLERKRFFGLSERELLIAGLFLYWGEGKKDIRSYVGISNTDPQLVKFSLYWLVRAMKVNRDKIRISLHLYSDMNVYKEMNYWSKELNIPLNQFIKPYIKKNLKVNLTHKGFGHGTCNIALSNILLKERVMMSLKAISDYYCSKI